MAKEKAHAEVDWPKYFRDIKSVCPWAYRAMQDEKILVWEYTPSQANTVISCFKHSKFEALVFTCDGKDSAWLEAMCDAENARDTGIEWLWSHPEHGGNSTPIPCLILQDAVELRNLRNKVGYEDE